MAVQFTDADLKKLQELQEKQRKAKAEERNEQKRNDRTCQKLFGMSAKEVKQKLEAPSTSNDYFNEYYELKQKITRLMAVMGKSYEEFDGYLEWREQKASENANNGQA